MTRHRHALQHALCAGALLLALLALLAPGTGAAAAPPRGRASSSSSSRPSGRPAGSKRRPNIVLILVDDQDATLNSTHPRYMPQLDALLRREGVAFSNYFCNTPICCPSRATLLTGRHSHNTNFTDVMPPYGGYTYFRKAGLDAHGYLPTWLQDLGYRTYYTGKLFVEYAVYNYSPPPAGWTDIDALVLPWVFDYTNPVFSRNGQRPREYRGRYSTDVIASKALAQLKTAAAAAKAGDAPFFLQVAPIAPHDEMYLKPGGDAQGIKFGLRPPVSAERHAKLYPDVTLPQKPDFNESGHSVADKPAWVRSLPPLHASNVTTMNEYYRRRLRALRAVDELVGRVVGELAAQGLLEDTYVIYTGDNGYHIGAHRQGAGKEAPYEDDIRLPFFIRGPGLQRGVVNPGIGSHVDLAATLVTLAGGQPSALSDGQPLPLAASATPGSSFFRPRQAYEAVPLEYWGIYLQQLSGEQTEGFTYKGVRADLGAAGTFKHIVWCNKSAAAAAASRNERELYDLTADPYELRNLAAPGSAPGRTPAAELRRISNRLDALLSAWYTCQGPDECVAPLQRVVPGAKSLADALHPSHDAFFEAAAPFAFKTCLSFFSWDNEAGAFDAQLRPSEPPTPPVRWSSLGWVHPESTAMLAQLAHEDALGQRAAQHRARGTGGAAGAKARLGVPGAASSWSQVLDEAGHAPSGGVQSASRRLTAAPVDAAGLVTHLAKVEAHARPLPSARMRLHAQQLAHAIHTARWQLGNVR